MNASVSLPLLAGAALALSGLTGCFNLQPASDPTRFYVLTPRCAPRPQQTAAASAPLLMLGRVEVADYLQRSELVWRRAPNHVAYAHFTQWAEPLQPALDRVLKENFLRLLGSGRFFAGVNPGKRPVEEIRVSILQFDLFSEGEARVKALCRIVDHQSRETRKQQMLTASRRFDLEAADTAPEAAALSEALADICRQIVALASAGPAAPPPEQNAGR
jgi:uncharacterized lipoprotein YmbA